MRFEVTRVMDAIERRLTTDVTLAQAVADLGDIARCVDLDRGRPVNLLRIGMAVDALSRYLVDEGAMLYAVAGRELLSESALTSKERMVLGRWLDDGLIEVTTGVADRPVEVADLTGLPLIAVRAYPEFAGRFPWLVESPERLLRLVPRSGGAVLSPMNLDTVDPQPARVVVVGKASVAPPAPADPAPAASTLGESTRSSAADAEPTVTVTSEPPAASAPEPDAEASSVLDAGLDAEPVATPDGKDAPEQAAEPVGTGTAEQAGEPVDVPVRSPLEGLEAFVTRGAQRLSHTLVVQRRFTRAQPSGMGMSLMARHWRCADPDCPVFGERRAIGQPVPRMRNGVATCPRHGDPVSDVGPRPLAYAMAIVVDDLARRRFVVRADSPVTVGRGGADDPDHLIATGAWLHEAAAAWVAPEHVRLEVGDGALVVTDISENGTVVWRRSGPDDVGTSAWLHGASYILGDWDTVELYTGVELVRGDRRLATTVGRAEPLSVLVDAPTAAHRQLA